MGWQLSTDRRALQQGSISPPLGCMGPLPIDHSQNHTTLPRCTAHRAFPPANKMGVEAPTSICRSKASRGALPSERAVSTAMTVLIGTWPNLAMPPRSPHPTQKARRRAQVQISMQHRSCEGFRV